MSLSPADDQILATCYRNLQPTPLEPDDPFYVEIWEHSDYDPVQRLRKHILLQEAMDLDEIAVVQEAGTCRLPARLLGLLRKDKGI